MSDHATSNDQYGLVSLAFGSIFVGRPYWEDCTLGELRQLRNIARRWASDTGKPVACVPAGDGTELGDVEEDAPVDFPLAIGLHAIPIPVTMVGPAGAPMEMLRQNQKRCGEILPAAFWNEIAGVLGSRADALLEAEDQTLLICGGPLASARLVYGKPGREVPAGTKLRVFEIQNMQQERGIAGAVGVEVLHVSNEGTSMRRFDLDDAAHRARVDATAPLGPDCAYLVVPRYD